MFLVLCGFLLHDKFLKITTHTANEFVSRNIAFVILFVTFSKNYVVSNTLFYVIFRLRPINVGVNFRCTDFTNYKCSHVTNIFG